MCSTGSLLNGCYGSIDELHLFSFYCMRDLFPFLMVVQHSKVILSEYGATYRHTNSGVRGNTSIRRKSAPALELREHKEGVFKDPTPDIDANEKWAQQAISDRLKAVRSGMSTRTIANSGELDRRPAQFWHHTCCFSEPCAHLDSQHLYWQRALAQICVMVSLCSSYDSAFGLLCGLLTCFYLSGLLKNIQYEGTIDMVQQPK